MTEKFSHLKLHELHEIFKSTKLTPLKFALIYDCNGICDF